MLKTPVATTFKLFGVVTLLCGLWDISLLSDDLVVRLNAIRATHSCPALPAFPFTHKLSHFCCGSVTISSAGTEAELNFSSSKAHDFHLERAE